MKSNTHPPGNAGFQDLTPQPSLAGAEIQLKAARKFAEENNLLKPLLSYIGEIEKHFQAVSSVADKHEDV